MTDESTDISSGKASCIVVRYFNEEKGQITSSFIDLVSLFKDNVESATAEVIFDAIVIRKCLSR